MPASSQPKKTTTASVAGRNLAQGVKAPSAREAKRAAAKAAPATAKPAPARQAPQEASAYTASAWGTQSQFELTCPSGQKCLAHEVTIERLVEMGLLEMVNSLSGVVELEITRAQGKQAPVVDMGKVMQNADTLMKVMALVNVVICEAVDAPELWPVPGEGEERVNGRVYVDTVGISDRMYIFSEVTGNMEGLASFREGPE